MLQNGYRMPRGSTHLRSWRWGMNSDREIPSNQTKPNLKPDCDFMILFFFCGAGSGTRGPPPMALLLLFF